MASEEHLQAVKQLDHILGLLKNRRERYKLWWNAFIGIVVAIGVGVGITVVLGRAELTPLNEARLIFVFAFVLPLLILLFTVVFCELHWVDDVEEVVILRFYTNHIMKVSYNVIKVQLLNALGFVTMSLPADTGRKEFVRRQNPLLGCITLVYIIAGLLTLSEISTPGQFRFFGIPFLIPPLLVGIVRYIGYRMQLSWLWDIVTAEELLKLNV